METHDKKPAKQNNDGVKKAEPHKNHRQRLKNRFLKDGFESFEPHNVLEFLLFFAIGRKDTNEIAHALIKRFGSVAGVLNASMEDLQSVEGIGEHSALFLHMLPQLFSYYVEDKIHEESITDQKTLFNYVSSKFWGLDHERVILISLNARLKVIAADVITVGSTTKASLEATQILEAAIKRRSKLVVLAHNHPQGYATPSMEDVAATKSIMKVLRVSGISLIDHIIYAPNGIMSMANNKRYSDMFRNISEE